MSDLDDKKYRAFVYKCRMCGVQEESFVTMTRLETIETLVKLEKSGLGADVKGGYISKTNMHFCENGDIGISDLQGISIITP